LPWTTNLSKGIEEAKSSKRYVLADIYTDWCGWCKRLDATTFLDPDFVKYANANFVCVKCNAEDNGEGTKAAQQNGVNGYPTALVYDANGKVIGKIVGFKKAKDYQDTLEQIIKNQPLEL
jgi:thiol:disulfide interchange protein